MATRGPKPKPKAVDKPGPIPERPDWVTSPRAVEFWDQYGQTLNGIGLLESLDAVGFGLLADAFAGYIEARDLLEADGEGLVVLVGESGSPQQNPLVSIVRQQAKAVRELLAEFGMTPTGRTRLKGSTSVKAIDVDARDPLEQLAERMHGTKDAAGSAAAAESVA